MLWKGGNTLQQQPGFFAREFPASPALSLEGRSRDRLWGFPVSPAALPRHKLSPTAERRAWARGTYSGGAGSTPGDRSPGPISAAELGALPAKPAVPGLPAPSRDRPIPRAAPARLTWPAQHCADITGADGYGLARPLPAPLRSSWFPCAARDPVHTTSRLHAKQLLQNARHRGQGKNNPRQAPPSSRSPAPWRRARPFPGTPRGSRIARGSHFRWRQVAARR